MDSIFFPALRAMAKRGDEKFTEGNAALPFGIIEFWRWMGSDLANNAMRGVLAEFIVARALGVKEGVRAGWDAFDLRTPEGIAVEVKSAAYCQTWAQRRLSRIGFDICPKRPDNIPANDRTQPARRGAQVYVFCVLQHRDKASLDPMRLDQWSFYVLPTRVLDERAPLQKSIALSALLKLSPVESDFARLATDVLLAAGGSQPWAHDQGLLDAGHGEFPVDLAR